MISIMHEKWRMSILLEDSVRGEATIVTLGAGARSLGEVLFEAEEMDLPFSAEELGFPESFRTYTIREENLMHRFVKEKEILGRKKCPIERK